MMDIKRLGFTLVEVLVVVAIAGVIAVLSAGIFLANNNFVDKQTGEIITINSARESADRLAELGRSATEILASRSFPGGSFATGSQTVIFKIPSIDASKNIIVNTFDYAAVMKNPTEHARLELHFDADPASTRLDRTLVLTNKLSSLAFTYDDVNPSLARRVDYDIVIAGDGRFPNQEQIRGSMSLRNK